MKRAVLVGTGTVAGVAAVLAFNPNPARTSASAVNGRVTQSTTGSTTTGGSTSDTTSTSTATGDAVDIGRGYGTIQLEVTVDSGRIVDITALAVPENDGHSARISQQAVPMLVQQALNAQSADIAGISGATYTSLGFVQSLKSALAQVGM